MRTRVPMGLRVSGTLVAALLALSACDSGGGDSGGGLSDSADQDSAAADSNGGASAAAGAPLYVTYCAFCHGEQGEGYASDQASALANGAFLQIATDEFLADAIRHGRPGTVMSAWSDDAGGPLDDAAIDSIVLHIRTWATEAPVDVDDVTVDGLASRGKAIYNARCADCHGEQGKGGEYQSIANPWFLATASDGYLRYSIQHGRPGTPMPAFGEQLTGQNIDDLVALVRSWAVPPGADPPKPAPPDLTNAVSNPAGASPAFELRDGRYVPVDDVHAALDSGQRLVLLDARPPSDFARSHITGAVNLPFYAVATYADSLPTDTWIIAYCGCPHAVSGQAADALLQSGFSLVAVLDEGFYDWEEKGYPVTYAVEAGAAK